MNFGSQKDDKCVREIYSWLDKIPFSRPKRNVSRDFSDGVLMAELMKRYYPRLVNLKHYFPSCNTAKKVDNWYTLNHKVFSKINIVLNKDTMVQLAQSQPGLIEKLLLEVRSRIVQDCNTNRNSLLKVRGNSELEEIKAATIAEESLDETVPKILLMKIKKELDEKTIAVQILLKKVEHLETVLAFKEQKIEDLTTQIQSLSPKT